MIPPDWLWIPITLGAAAAQTARNAAQRHLTPVLGTLGATLVRFLYGLPFAVLFLGALNLLAGLPVPAPNVPFMAWIVVGSVTQIVATALLLRVMAERNFALGTAYTKTEVIQIAIFGLLFLGDPLGATTLFAIVVSTAGVLLLAPIDRTRPLTTFLRGWTTRAAQLGLLSGAFFGIAAVTYRGAALALEDANFIMAAAVTLVAAQALQTALLGGWLLARESDVVVRVVREWRRSIFAGLMGATASAGWFTALAIEPAAHVRTLGLIEIVFGYAIALRLFRESVSKLEAIGLLLLIAGIAMLMLGR